MKSLLLSVIFVALPAVIFAYTMELNIYPEYAREYMKNADLKNIDYAVKTGEDALPEVRNEEGKIVYMGRVIDNPEDYVEEKYDVQQYHGQDGTGQYTFGYNDGSQSKHETRDETGTVSGSYKLRQPDGSEYTTDYVANATGYYLKNPPTKTPEVLKAEQEHEQAWIRQAELTGANPDRNAPEYRGREGYYDPSADEKYNNVHQEVKYQPGPGEMGQPMGFYYESSHNAPMLKKLTATS